jgi:hypothetical protein
MVHGRRNWNGVRGEWAARQRKTTNRLPDDAICTLTNDVQELIVTADSETANAGVCDVFHVCEERGSVWGCPRLSRPSHLIIVFLLSIFFPVIYLYSPVKCSDVAHVTPRGILSKFDALYPI